MNKLRHMIRTFRIGVSLKLGGLISLLLVAAVFGLVTLSTHLFVDYNTAQIQQITFDTAANLSTQMRQTFESTTDKMRILGSFMLGEDAKPIQDLISRDTQLLGLFLHRQSAEGGELSVRTQALSSTLTNYDVKDLTEKGLNLPEVLKQGEAGSQVFITQVMNDIPVVVLAIPFVKEGERFTHTLTAVLRAEIISGHFTELTNITGYLVDPRGTVVAHTEQNRALARENFANVEIVRDFMAGKKAIQKEYLDPIQSAPALGAFRAVGFAGLGVVAEVPKARAFEGANRVRYQSLLAASIVLFLSFMVGNYFSARTITGPILLLVEAAQRIARGDFKIALSPKGNDEIGDLSISFNQMAQGLEERDKVKAVFNKFHNEAIAAKLLSGEVKLGGDRLHATVFFSDVRGFTSLSESMQPEQVVEMLNEYMTCMVSVITAHKGVVDKYVGDAIMALWGVPIASPDDTVNAVNACLAMRCELDRLNQIRINRGQPALKIGMGLNCGEVIAGNIGSEQKMEYTVIGDVVNVASRVESMTKEYGTDFLISDSVHAAVKDRFIFETCKSARVKGKKEALGVFKVRGYIDANGAPVSIVTPYSDYASEKSDKGVHDEAPEPVASHEADDGMEKEIDLSGFIRKAG